MKCLSLRVFYLSLTDSLLLNMKTIQWWVAWRMRQVGLCNLPTHRRRTSLTCAARNVSCVHLLLNWTKTKYTECLMFHVNLNICKMFSLIPKSIARNLPRKCIYKASYSLRYAISWFCGLAFAPGMCVMLEDVGSFFVSRDVVGHFLYRLPLSHERNEK